MKLPDFSEERKLWRKGFKVVIGVDEVGRGAWAGPVVASAVCFGQRVLPGFIPIRRPPPQSGVRALDGGPPRDILTVGINDSKALRSRKRRQLADIIKECSLGWTIGEVGVGKINKVGIGKATSAAMRRAITTLLKRSDLEGGQTSPGKAFILVDGFHVRYLAGIGLKNQKAIKKGDQKSISIAAASILAKVYRDKLMKKLSRKYPQYGWGRNKGYGTKKHQEAILKYGTTRLHRRQFVETFLRKTQI